MIKLIKPVIILIYLFLALSPLKLAAQERKASSGIDTFTGEFVESIDTPYRPMTLWYRRPANVWTEALPVGNGRLGAMIFGGVEGERIQLNEGTLYAGGPYDPIDPGALANLPEVRKLIFEGKYKQAADLIDGKMMSKPLKQMPYQTLGDLQLTFSKRGNVTDYRRTLDIENAVAGVQFMAGNIQYNREVFTSATDNVIIVRLTAGQLGQISFTAAMDTPQKAEVTVENNDTLVMRGLNGEARGIPGALKFQSRVKVIARGGETKAQGNQILIERANSAFIIVTAATSYKNYNDVAGDPEAITKRTIETTAKKAKRAIASADPDSLRKACIFEYQKLFRRVSLDLGTSDAAKLPTDERIRNFANGNDPQLAALYFQYGRYLLISSSRPGGQPANLQGIWNDSMTPPWDSKYTININTEMNYWPAEPANLSEMTEPLTKMVMDLTETGAKTAQKQWGARGWVAHHNTDLWRATGPIDAARYGMWPTGGAWLTTHLWEHYEYTGDKAYLAKIYPALKGASQFFLDTLVKHPKYEWLVTNPSISPENHHPFGTAVVEGPAMDSQILRDLFANTIRAAEILSVDKEFREDIARARAKLAPDRIGKNGQLQEWLEDWDMQAPQMQHRHVSHLYAAFPSWQINVYDTPELAKAVKRSLEIRGDDATGWAIAWRLNLWARLHDGEHAYKILALLLRPERTYPNLFDAHPPFQIDGNFGGTNGISEMLMQNRVKDGVTEIIILPALPTAFPRGKIIGLRARGGFQVDIEWRDGILVGATAHSKAGNPLRFRYGGIVKDLAIKKGGTVAWNGKP